MHAAARLRWERVSSAASALPLPLAAQKPNGSKASPSCQGIIGKWCHPIKNCCSLLLLCEGLRRTGICVSPARLYGLPVCTKSGPGAAASFPLHANELSCSGSSKPSGRLSCGLRATPKTLGMASPKGQGQALRWKPALPRSASKNCTPALQWRG